MAVEIAKDQTVMAVITQGGSIFSRKIILSHTFQYLVSAENIADAQ